MPGDYKHLNAARIVATLERLGVRIEQRFPGAGLARVCAELTEAARATAARAARLSRPNWALRIAVSAVIVGGLAAQAAAAKFFSFASLGADAPALLQGLEAAVNLLIIFGGAAWFLLTLEERVKRRRALDALHELRALAHVIDMHQLTKDPTISGDAGQDTPASPARRFTPFELTRYLDYCAEMLALIGKLAALYADRMRDSVVISAVNEIEDLTTNLARKIWQKIMIISAGAAREPHG